MSASKQRSQPRLTRMLQQGEPNALVREVSHTERPNGVRVYHVRVRDGYEHWLYAVERAGSRFFAARLNAYLKKRPDMAHDHPKNLANKALYRIPAFKEWSQFMPDSFALEPIYHPEQTHLASGGRLDPMTRRLFRHGLDPVGVRTRTVTGAWLVSRWMVGKPGKLCWLSLAGGTLRPTMLMLVGSGPDPARWSVTDVDRDAEALKTAKEVAEAYGIPARQVQSLAADVTDEKVLRKHLGSEGYDVIDMMGLFEYLTDIEVAGTLKFMYAQLRPGGMLLFGNMRRKHPQLDLHKRGVGWPGVRPRSVEMVSASIEAAKIPLANVEVYQPADGVYNVYKIVKN